MDAAEVVPSKVQSASRFQMRKFLRKLSKPERAALASKAAKARWKKSAPGENASLEQKPIVLSDENTSLPVAKWPGMLSDVAQWLRENAPSPKHGQNYHQWLTSQYGLKKLIEHIWKVIGVASTCDDGALKDPQYKMEQLYGKKPGFQYALRLVSADRQLPE